MNRIAPTIVIISTLLSTSYSDTEPNDTFGQATAITVNTTVNGSLGTTDPDDWYRIDLPHDGALRVVVIPGSTLNTHIKLFDQDGTTALNFNGGAYGNQGSFGEPDTALRADLKSGTYFITVSRFGSDGGQGSYDIGTVFTPTEYPDHNDTEPNDSFSAAITLNVNTSDTGHLGYYKDGATDRDDWYRIDLPHDGALQVVIFPGTALNTHVKLFDQDGTTALNFNGGAYGNQGSFGDPDTALRADLKSGTYYVTVSQWGVSGQGSYIIRADFTPTEYPDHNDTEPNDSLSAAITLNVNTSDTGHLGYYKDGATDRDDWYRIDLPHDGALQVVIFPGTALNTHVKLFDQDGTTALNFNGGAYGNQGSFGDPDTALRADLKSGTYYVTVSQWGVSGQGSYIIRTDFTPTEYPDHNDTEPNDSFPDAIALNVNTSVRGHLGYYKDGVTDRDDWYRIVLPHDGALRVVVSPGSALNTHIKLFDQDGTTALNFNGGAYGNQGSFGEPDTALQTDLKSGTYYVTVSQWGVSGQGSYVLKASTGRDHNYSISIDPQVAHANLDTVRFRFNNRLIDDFKTCLNIGLIFNENNQRFATYACLDGYMWIEHDSVLTIRFDIFSSLGSDTGTIGVILKKVLFQNGDTLDCDTIFFRWSTIGTAVVKQSPTLPGKCGVDDISFSKDKIAGIRIALPQPASVSISVYTLSGKLITTKHLYNMKAGYHTVSYHYGTLASGSYILKIRAATVVVNRRFNLSR